MIWLGSVCEQNSVEQFLFAFLKVFSKADFKLFNERQREIIVCVTVSQNRIFVTSMQICYR